MSKFIQFYKVFNIYLIEFLECIYFYIVAPVINKKALFTL